MADIMIPVINPGIEKVKAWMKIVIIKFLVLNPRALSIPNSNVFFFNVRKHQRVDKLRAENGKEQHDSHHNGVEEYCNDLDTLELHL